MRLNLEVSYWDLLEETYCFDPESAAIEYRHIVNDIKAI